MDLIRPGRLRSISHGRFIVIAALVLAFAAIGAWLLIFHGPRRPPNIFDTPVDDVTAYLASKDFNSLSTEERLKYIEDMLQRFQSMSQPDSATAAAFFAGLTGRASEQLMHNARTLGKDILVEGARQYLTLQGEAEKTAFIEKWVVDWVRFLDQMGPRQESPGGGRSDGEILDRLTRQARREAPDEINAMIAQQVIDFWERDIASVASPVEQGQIFIFVPAVRNHMLMRGK